jgi:putative tricarboxylic transport membrane protein
MLVQVTRSAPDAETATILPRGQAALQAGLVVVALAVAAALIEPLGFRLTMLPFLGGLLVALGARSVVAVSLTAIAGSFGVFHVFYYWLKVPLPIGAFGL